MLCRVWEWQLKLHLSLQRITFRHRIRQGILTFFKIFFCSTLQNTSWWNIMYVGPCCSHCLALSSITRGPSGSLRLTFLEWTVRSHQANRMAQMLVKCTIKLGVKGKIVLVYTMKEYRGGRCMAVLILNFSTRWRWVINITLRRLHPRERTSILNGGQVGPWAGLEILEKFLLLTGFMKMVRNDIPPCSMHNSQLFGTGLQPDWHNVALSSKCLTRECFLLTDFRLIWYSVRLRGDAHAPSQHSSVLCRGDVANILRRATCVCVSWTVQCCCWHRSIHKACLITCRFLTMSYHT
jgi:hypothetical protein